MFDVRKKHTITAVTKELTQKLNELNSADGDAIEVRSLIILKQIWAVLKHSAAQTVPDSSYP